MKLKDCTLGVLVRVKGDDSEIGHVVGLTFNVDIRFTGNMSKQQLVDATIPLIRFADKTERGVHPSNLELL
jgi:hypothetical protein